MGTLSLTQNNGDLRFNNKSAIVITFGAVNKLSIPNNKGSGLANNIVILQQFCMGYSQPGDGYTWRRTGDIIQFDMMTETNRLRMSALFTANAYGDIGTGFA